MKTMPEKLVVPRFKTEAEEAAWWSKNQDLIADGLEKAVAAKRVGRSTVARLARARSSASLAIILRIPQADITRARSQAARKGLPCQKYLKMLLHDALDRRERTGR